MKFQSSAQDVWSAPLILEGPFLASYLSLANEAQLKVYLYGRYLSQWQMDVSEQDFEEALQMPWEQIHAALVFWIDQGLVQLQVADGGETDFIFCACAKDEEGSSLTESNPPVTSLIEDRAPAVPDRVREGMAIRQMIDELEAYLSRGQAYAFRFKNNEIEKIHDLMSMYPITPAFFLHAYQRAVEMKSTSNQFSYVMAVIENWIRYEHLMEETALDTFLDEKKNEGQTRRRRKVQASRPSKGKNVDRDTRMTKEERRAEVRERMERRSRLSLRGEDDGESSE